MVPRGTGPSTAPTGKLSVEQMDVRNQIDLKPSPVWQRATAGTGELISQKLDRAVLDTVVMRFDNAAFLVVDQLDQPFLPNRLSQ